MNGKAILALCAAALSASSATAAERTLSVTTFDKVRLDGPFSVRLTTGVSDTLFLARK